MKSWKLKPHFTGLTIHHTDEHGRIEMTTEVKMIPGLSLSERKAHILQRLKDEGLTYIER